MTCRWRAGAASPLLVRLGIALLGSVVGPGLCAQTDNLNEPWRWTRFAVNSGLPSNSVHEVLETADGTAWACTERGLAWYDGFRWHPVGRATEPTSPRCRSIADSGADSGGGEVLIIIEKDLFRADRKSLRQVPLQRDGKRLYVNSIATLGGKTLLDLEDGSVLLYEDGRISAFGITPLAHALRSNLYRTRSGAVWINGPAGLHRWEGSGPVLRFRHRYSADTVPVTRVDGLAENESGEGVMSIGAPRERRGLWEWKPGESPVNDARQGTDGVRSMDIAPSGDVMVVYESGHVRLRRRGAWSTLVSVPDGLRGVHSLRYRQDGSLWVATQNGLFLFRPTGGRWTNWQHPFPDPRNTIHEILPTRDGSVWLANLEGVEIRRPDGSSRWIRELQGRPLGVVTGLAEDNDGNVWVSSGSSFAGAWRWDGRRWRHFGPGEGFAVSTVHKIRKDSAGRLWFLSTGAFAADPSLCGAFLYSEGAFTRWGRDRGLLEDRVYAFAEGRQGELWFGGAEGLSRWKAGAWTHWRVRRELKPSNVFTLAVDRRNRLWFGDRGHGLGYIDEQDRARYLTSLQGLVGDEVWDLMVDREGAVWISTRSGLGGYKDGVWIRLQMEAGLPTPHLWPVAAVGDQVCVGTMGSGVYCLNRREFSQSPPRARIERPVIEEDRVLFRWLAASYWGAVPPNEIETRLRLDNGPWSVWSRGREINLREVAFGEHRFQVQAKGLLGNWDADGAGVSFRVLPPVYLRPVFFLPVGLSLLAAAGFGLTLLRRRILYTRELAAARLRAEKASRAKSDFLATMSHEIRTPMNGVMGMTEILLDTPLTADQRDCAETIRVCGEALLALINDVLDLSRIEAGRIILDSAPFDLRETLRDVIRVLAPAASQKLLDLRLEYPDDASSRFVGDAGRLRQVALNLAGNAVKFTERGSVFLVARCLEHTPADALIEVSVRDTGIGIPEDKLGIVFERFTQADASTTRRYGGTGLGLAISRSLVEMMGGTIGVDSKEGEGSTFAFTLRLPPAPQQAEEKPAGLPVRAASANPGKVLLVEDNAVNRLVMTRALERLGCAVRQAASGEEALDLWQDDRYSLVFMDLQMPGMDGYSAAAEMRRREVRKPRTPIIAFTATTLEDDLRRCTEAGMDDFLSKPVALEALDAVVRRWTGQGA